MPTARHIEVQGIPMVISRNPADWHVEFVWNVANQAFALVSPLSHEEWERLAGLSGKTYDEAVPQAWFDAMLDSNSNPRGYVWLYEPHDAFGQPYNWLKHMQELGPQIAGEYKLAAPLESER